MDFTRQVSATLWHSHQQPNPLQIHAEPARPTRLNRPALLALGLVVVAAGARAAARHTPPSVAREDWPAYYGSPGNDHYSALNQIATSNVSNLKEVWRFDTHESGGLETTPLVIGRTLYALTPSQHVIALEAATGKRLWTFDSGIPATGPNRGLTYWQSGNERRLFAGIMNRLYALDPATGKPIETFGQHGFIDLQIASRCATHSIEKGFDPALLGRLLDQ